MYCHQVNGSITCQSDIGAAALVAGVVATIGAIALACFGRHELQNTHAYPVSRSSIGCSGYASLMGTALAVTGLTVLAVALVKTAETMTKTG